MDKQRIYLEGTFSEINKDERITLCGLLIKRGTPFASTGNARGRKISTFTTLNIGEKNEGSDFEDEKKDVDSAV